MSTVSSYLKQMPRWAKISGIFLILVFILLTIGNRLARNYIQNNGEAWIGRKLALGSVRINPLNFSFALHDLKVYEKDSDTVFFSFDRFYANISPFAYLFNKRLVITEMELTAPQVRIVMNKNSFNFDDLLQRFVKSSDSTVREQEPTQAPIRFAIEDVSLTNGAVDFMNETFGGALSLDSIFLRCPAVSADQLVINFDLGVRVSSGGTLNFSGNFDQDNLAYAIAINGHSVNVGFLLPFVDKVMYVSGLTGLIDTQLNVGGDLKNAVSEAEGFVRLSGFQLLDTIGKPSVGLDKFELQIDTISAIERMYSFSKVSIGRPFLRFDLTAAGNNLIRNTATRKDSASMPSDSLHVAEAGDGQVDEYLSFFKLLNDYFYTLGKAYAINFYSLDSLILDNGNIEFNDYTLNTQFHFLFEDLNITAANVRSDMDSILVDLHSALNKSGILEGRVLLKPKQVGDMYMHYTLNGLKISDFSPYSEYYVAHPFWDGVVFFESTSEVKDQNLDSDNRLVIRNLEVGDKLKHQTPLDLPLKLAVSLLKDVHGNVDLRVPLKGNVNDPKFRIMPVVLKIFKDLIIKAVASPYKLLASTFNADEDDLRDIKYDYLQFNLRGRQTKALNLLARILNQKKDMKVELIHLSNPQWEVDQYALFEAKRMYYAEKNNKSVLSFDDSVAIDGIQRLDTAFNTFLKERVRTASSAEVEQLAIQLVGMEKTHQLLMEVETKRKSIAEEYLAAKIEDHSRFTIIDATAEDAANHRERPKLVVLFSVSSSEPLQ
ncbi:MAG: DUF748 domain-containing protein [Cyclobacteriaceae bacterium]|nr:DUF748 domain-containing protein [Cyclobacteriaceae bacterium]MDH5250790.1 DUF748 domain-containing protein [Cyclobacteriaceae bacterium]